MRRFFAGGVAVWALSLGPAWASDYLFLNDRYVSLTQDVLKEADAVAPGTLEKGSAPETKYRQAVEGLRQQLSAVTQAQLFKKLKPEMVAQIKDQQFADNLNTFKFALTFMATKSGKTASELYPSYDAWIKTETAVVQMGVDQRLKAYQTRFGPDSEQVNFLELFGGEIIFPGNEAGPSPWEPIVRLSAVQLTTTGPGLVSSFEWGMNYYFVNGPTPVPLNWLGLSNHVGAALTLQYLNDPHLLHFEGRPAFGVAVHLDRKELGANWDPNKRRFSLTLGYAFQFVPFLM